MNDEFYIGYLDRYPPALRRWIRGAIVIVGLLLLVTASVVAIRQRPVETGRFEFGQLRTFVGEIVELPFPILHLEGQPGVETNYVLVDEGKHGAPAWFRGKHGHRVALTGSLIQKGVSTMIEVASDPAPRDEGLATFNPLRIRVLGMVNLKGELVDTKCYFGVMRPGEGKVHRGCAARCLSGGVPPGLLVRDTDGVGHVVLLAGEESWEPLHVDPQWAARMVDVRGELERTGNLLILRVHQLSLAD